MKLVIGLGNPGKKFIGTRHNVGFMVVDRLAGEGEWTESRKGELEFTWLDAEGSDIELIKPLTMMNNSGRAVAYAKRKHPVLHLEDLYIVHDDLDIPLGKYKIQLGKGPRVHGGLQSIYKALGSKDFWHVRLGIESFDRAQDKRRVKGLGQWVAGEEYVLQKFSEEEQTVIEQVIEQVVFELGRMLG